MLQAHHFGLSEPNSTTPAGRTGNLGASEVAITADDLREIDKALCTQGLPEVEPIYTWVRLAQRIPVRIRVDKVPERVVLSAGMTATMIVSPRNQAGLTTWDKVRARVAALLTGSWLLGDVQ